MMKCEFENLIGCEIPLEEYEKVETVYMAWNYKDMSKEKIADLYKYDRELVIDTLYNYIIKHDGTEVDRLKREKGRANRIIGELKDKINSLRNSGLYYVAQTSKLEQRVEELETELHQYKALFSDIGKNMTVSLYETLLGVTE